MTIKTPARVTARIASVLGAAATMIGASAVHADLADRANAALGLFDGDVITIDLPAPGDPVLAAVVLDDAAGVLFLMPDPARGLSGVVLGLEGATATGARLGGGLHVDIELASGDAFRIEPLVGRVVGAEGSDHVIYRMSDAIDAGDLGGNDGTGAEAPTGACCIDGGCTMRTRQDCANNGGTYGGDGVSCAQFTCPTNETGGCCLVDTCTEMSEDDCLAGAGVYAGDGTDCEGETCDATAARLVCLNVNKGTGRGTMSRITDSNNHYVRVASKGNAKHRTRTTICVESPFQDVSAMLVKLETRATRRNVRTWLYLRNWTSGKWTRVAKFKQRTRDRTRGYRVPNPDRFVHPTSDRILIRVVTEGEDGAYRLLTDHIEVRLQPDIDR